LALRGEFPEEGELVVGTVTSIRNFGAFVTLDEYAKKEAFIHLSEVATGWVKYIRDHVREGQKIVARVLRVDRSKGQVDLSLKRINDHQRRERIQLWKNEQRAAKLLAVVAKELKMEEPDTHALFAESLVEKYGSVFHAFEVASNDAKKFQKEHGKDPWVAAFLSVAADNLAPAHVTISGTLQIRSTAPDGLLRVREALKAAEAVSPDSIRVQYVGAPRYRIRVDGTQYKKVEDTLKKATEVALEKIRAAGGEGSFARP
jgi:translation initiation factor 2 subunit 1